MLFAIQVFTQALQGATQIPLKLGCGGLLQAELFTDLSQNAVLVIILAQTRQIPKAVY